MFASPPGRPLADAISLPLAQIGVKEKRNDDSTVNDAKARYEERKRRKLEEAEAEKKRKEEEATAAGGK